jgi:(p)ppGpp synthase/HD superfamily hydrolase
MYQNKYIPILISKSLIKSNDRFFLNDNINSSILEYFARMEHVITKDFLQRIKQELQEKIKKAGIKCRIFIRKKTILSSWVKTLKKQIKVEELNDLIGVRIIVDSIKNCYSILEILHTSYIRLYKYFKDYIRRPKDNGYQSIHTVIIGSLLQKIEVQIRTKAMDEVAELGHASHYHYKISQLLHVLNNSSMPAIQRVLTTFLRKCNIRESSIPHKPCRALDLQFNQKTFP